MNCRSRSPRRPLRPLPRPLPRPLTDYADQAPRPRRPLPRPAAAAEPAAQSSTNENVPSSSWSQIGPLGPAAITEQQQQQHDVATEQLALADEVSPAAAEPAAQSSTSENVSWSSWSQHGPLDPAAITEQQQQQQQQRHYVATEQLALADNNVSPAADDVSSYAAFARQQELERAAAIGRWAAQATIASIMAARAQAWAPINAPWWGPFCLG